MPKHHVSTKHRFFATRTKPVPNPFFTRTNPFFFKGFGTPGNDLRFANSGQIYAAAGIPAVAQFIECAFFCAFIMIYLPSLSAGIVGAGCRDASWDSKRNNTAFGCFWNLTCVFSNSYKRVWILGQCTCLSQCSHTHHVADSYATYAALVRFQETKVLVPTTNQYGRVHGHLGVQLWHSK